MIRMFIENKELDISKDLSQKITYAIDDIRNLDSKSTAFTKTIVLPGTANNNNLLGNIFDLNNSNFTNDLNPNVEYNFNAAKAAKCRVDADGMRVIKGVFRLLKIIRDGADIEYECSVVGELGGFAMKLAANKIEDLDFSAYDHTYNAANISASWDHAGDGYGYYYPLMDYGNYGLNSKHDWKINTFRPALFAKEYIDKIFESAGYTYECDLFSTDRFKRLVIPHNQKVMTAYVPNLLTMEINTLKNNFASPASARILHFDVLTGTGLTDSNTKSRFTYTGTQPITIEIDYNLIGNCAVAIIHNSLEEGHGIFQVLKNGTTTSGNHAYQGVYNISGVVTLSLVNGDYFELLNYPTYLSFVATSYGLVHITSVPPITIPISEGDPVTLNTCIPLNILQKDFFVSIMKLFNLFVDEDNFDEKHLVIKPFPDYYTGEVEDWSDKIDRGRPMELEPMSELNARYYEFNWRQDNDYYNELYRKRYNEGYGCRTHDTVYDFAKETQTMELIFAGTPIVGYGGEEKVYSTIFKQTGNPPTTTEENVDSVIRILLAKKMTGLTSWNIRNVTDTTTLGSYTTYGYAGHLNDPDAPSNDLNFGVPRELFFVLVSGDITVNQFNVYYSAYMAEITDKDSRMLKCFVKLNDADIHNLSFAKYKYIDGGLYRLNKVLDYTPNSNETTKCELLRVIYQTYL